MIEITTLLEVINNNHIGQDNKLRIHNSYVAYIAANQPHWILVRHNHMLDSFYCGFFRSESSGFCHTKFHVTLPETDKCAVMSEFSRGLGLVSAILSKYTVRSFKIYTPLKSLEAQRPNQRGKVITVYGAGNPSFTQAGKKSLRK